MLVLFKGWKKHNVIQLIKNKMDSKSLHPPLFGMESHPVTDPLGKTVEETGVIVKDRAFKNFFFCSIVRS